MAAASTTRTSRPPRPLHLTPREIAGLVVLHGFVSSAGYEVLSRENGDAVDAARNIVERSLEISDLFLDAAGAAS